MDLENYTRFPAAIFRGCIDDDRLCASVVSRVTYDLLRDQLVVAADQTWPISPGPWESPYGLMAGDELFYRGGVDVFVLGNARTPGGVPAQKSEVRVEVGDNFSHSIAVFGDRVWQRSNGKLTISDAVKFTEIPLVLTYAYGGADEWDELPIPYQSNPVGIGYYLEESTAEGKRLPNIECVEYLIHKWDDRPEPIGMGLCPPGFGPRLRESVEFDTKTGQMTKIHPTFFNSAFPGMVAPAVSAGDQVRVSGVRADGPITFNLPTSGMLLRLGFGDQVTELGLPIDQIGIESDLGKVFLTFRYPFRYKMIPKQKRTCQLLWDDEGATQ